MTVAVPFTYNARMGRKRVKADPINFRLSPEVVALLMYFEDALGKDRTALVEEAVKEFAAARGINVERTASGANVTGESPSIEYRVVPSEQ